MNSQMDPEFRNATSFQVKEKVIKSVVLLRFLDDKTAFTCSKVEQQTFCDWWRVIGLRISLKKFKTPALLLLTCFYEDS